MTQILRGTALLLLIMAAPALAAGPLPAPAAGAQVPAAGMPAAATPTGRVVTLPEALATALSRQPQLASARAQTEAAAARAHQARAAFAPQVSTSLGYSRSTANGTAKVGSYSFLSNSTDMYNNFSYGLTASYLLYDFGATENQYQAARAAIDAQKEGEKTTALAIALSVRSAYYTARAARTMVAVAREALSNQERHLKQIQRFVSVGMRPPIDLYQARTDVANARADLITAENNYETAKATLNQAMGIEGGTDFDVSDDPAPPVQGEDGMTEPLLDEALKARPEFAALAAQAKAKELSLKAVTAGYWPTVGLSGSYTGSGEELGETGWNFGLGVTATWSLYKGGLTQAQSAELLAGIRDINAQVDSMRQGVRLEIEQARLAVRAAKASLAATADAVAAARETLRLAEGRYGAGVGNILELSDAQLVLTRAEAAAVSAEYNLSSARARLLKALGRAETAGQ